MFRVAAFEIIELRKTLDKLEARYEECPFYCQYHEEEFDIERKEFCSQCPRQKQKAITDAQIREAIEVKLKREIADDELMDLKAKVSYTQNILDLPLDKMSLYSGYLVSIYQKEKYR